MPEANNVHGGRALRTTVIQFGFVSIPVRVYASSSDTHSHEFHTYATCHNARVNRKYVCSVCGNEAKEVRKGIEFGDKVIFFTDEELESLAASELNGISISGFVPAQDFKLESVEKVYYLGPDQKVGSAPLDIFAAALKKTGLMAVGKISIRGVEHKIVIKVDGDRLVMVQCFWDDELRQPVYTVPEKLDSPEVQMAVEVITRWGAGKPPVDETHERFKKLLERKLLGLHAPVKEEVKKTVGLMEALQKQLEYMKKEGA